MSRKIVLAAILATIAKLTAAGPLLARQDQSYDPGLGGNATNPQAQGATALVTAGAGPNG